jgi:hypothetical protein
MRSARASWLLVGVVAGAALFAPAATSRPAVAGVAGHPGRTIHQLAHPEAPVLPAALPRQAPLAVLQMNLCNSGFAGCYAGGQSIPEAAAVIAAQRPDVVTLNEVCDGDVTGALAAAMRQTWPADHVFAQFQPAWNRANNAPYRCANGQQYGIGVLGHVAPAAWAGIEARSGIYPAQNAGSNEERAWVCVYAVGDYYACTTHLESDVGSVALAQCQYLMGTAVPATRAAFGGNLPAVVSGDLNLRYGGSPNAQACVPTGWFRKGDNSVQHVLATSDFGFVSTRKTGMRHTDHPAWQVNLRTP